jgi:hypothetical protein
MDKHISVEFTQLQGWSDMIGPPANVSPHFIPFKGHGSTPTIITFAHSGRMQISFRNDNILQRV